MAKVVTDIFQHYENISILFVCFLWLTLQKVLCFSSLCVSVRITPWMTAQIMKTSSVEEGNSQMQIYSRINIVQCNERILISKAF